MDEETKKEIGRIIDETHLDDVKCGVCCRKYLKISADTLEIVSEISRGIAIVTAFLVPVWQQFFIISGVVGTVGLVCKGTSSFAMKESKERTVETNRILTEIKSGPLVDIAIDSAGNQDREKENI